MNTLFQFLPFSRRGAAATIKENKPTRNPESLAELKYKVTGGAEKSYSTKFPVLGPEHVAGLVPGQIRRVSPAPGSDGDSANYLAYVEFVHPDLPWLFSPALQDENNQIRPWINLIVVPVVEGRPQIVAGSPNPSIAVSPHDIQDPSKSWAWAHVQVTVNDEADDVQALLSSGSNPMAVSRLLCPRKLQPHTNYLACVVPTYEVGRQAGLGEVISEPSPGDLTLAWNPTLAQDTVKLPVFHHWYFRTGPKGDFETLAQRLFPFYAADTKAGQRTVLMAPKVSRFPADAGFSPGTIRARTAIANDKDRGPWAPGVNKVAANDRQKVHLALKKLINLSARREDADGRSRPVVGPPIYGQWHAQKHAVTYDDAAQQEPDWLEEVNLDPELRMAAGTGARIVRMDQEDLMAEAWRQLKAIEEANRRARWSQVYMTASIPLHETRLKRLDVKNLLRVTAASLGRLRVEPAKTMASQLQETTLPVSMVSANFERTARYAVKALGREGQEVTAESFGNQAVKDLLVGKGGLFNQRLSVPSYLPTQDFDTLFEQDVRDRFNEYRNPDFDRGLDELPGLVSSLRETVTQELRAFDTQQPEVEVDHTPGVAGHTPRGLAAGAREGIDTLQVQVETPQTIHAHALDTLQVHAATPGLGAGAFVAPAGGNIGRRNMRVLLRPQGADVRVHPEIALQAHHQVTVPIGQFSPIANHQFIADNNIPVLLDEQGNQAGLLLNAGQVDQLAGPLGVAELRPIQDFLITRPVRDSFRTFAATVGGENADLASKFVERSSVKQAALAKINPAIDYLISPIIAEAAQSGETFEDLPPGANEIWKKQKEVQAEKPFFTFAAAEDAPAKILDLLEPRAQYTRMLTWAIQLTSIGNVVGQPRRRSPAHQIMFAPKFNDALFNRLKRLDPRWVLGHAEELPVNSVSVFSANSRFVEALLVGANYEMARELLWRRYPTDLMGTSFARFWSDSSDDVVPLDTWKGALGCNGARGNNLEHVIAVFRGDLLRVYPGTRIAAVKGKVADNKVFHLSQEQLSRRDAVFRQRLDPDYTVVGLPITYDDLRAPDDNNECWYIELTQPADEPRFGLDETEEFDNEVPDDQQGQLVDPPRSRKAMSWQNMASQVHKEDGHLYVDGFNPPLKRFSTIEGQDEVEQAKAALWGKDSDAGQIGALLYQQPFQVLLRARDYIAEKVVPDAHH